MALRYHTQQERDDFCAVLEKYQEVLKFLNRRMFFSDTNVREFQAVADEYGTIWRDVVGRDGQTNYEHYIWAGLSAII